VKRATCLVSGRVQGVGFRMYARKWAFRLGIAGYARNLSDGRVEVVGEGEAHLLKQFVERICQGPQSGRVDHCDARWEEPTGEFPDFAIRKDAYA